MAITIWAPIGYLAFLIGSLWTFSKIHRNRKSKQPVATSWFPRHKSRDIYVSLLSTEPTPSRAILVAALLERAMEDVKLIWSIRDAKASLNVLHERGQIGDELWERFMKAEKELESEIVEVVEEANTFQEGYGQVIFGLASDMVNHRKWQEVYEGIGAARELEKSRAKSNKTTEILAPYSYLTASSLALLPSNPLVDLPPVTTSPNPALSLTLTPSPLASTSTTTTPPPAPFTSLPPSRTITPLPNATISATNATKKPISPTTPVLGSPIKQQQQQVTEEKQLPSTPSVGTNSGNTSKSSSGTSSPILPMSPLTPGSGTTTPGGSAKKKNKKKKGKAPPVPGQVEADE